MNNDQTTIANREDAGDTPVELDELTGQLISGRYQVEECLGRGAMGEVYRATHTLMAKTVAIKVLRSQLEQRDDLVERFRREAQAAAHIDHPNICAASDFGQMDDGTFFLVIEYLEGHTLEDAIEARAPISAAQTIDIAVQVASGLSRAHELDVIHRDLKPENIMLVAREDGQDFVKILDFGVARVRLTEQHENAQLTQAGTVWGTPLYMAPEQAAGGEVDGRSDLYSLGVILYEMLCGRPPFKDSNPARVMAMHLTHQPRPPSEYAPEAKIPLALETLVLELLDKDPNSRPASASALIERLEACRDADKLPIAQRAQDIADQSSVLLKRAVNSSETGVARALTWFRAQETLTQGIVLGVSAALLLAVILVPTIAVISTIAGSSGSTTAAAQAKSKKVRRNLKEKRADFIKEAGLDDVPVALAENRTSDALSALDNAAATYGDNPHFAYLSGRTNAVRGRWQASIDAYKKALSAEPLYANDSQLVDDIFVRFSDPKKHRAAPAQELIEEYLDTVYATQKLAEVASESDSGSARKRAYQVLESTKRMDDLEDWSRLSIQMGNAKNCNARKKIIPDIVKAGDPRGLKVLRAYASKSTRGCGFLSLEDCHACMRGDLRDAIQTLEKEE